MKTEEQAEPTTKPETLDSWPPLTHLIRGDVRPGKIALCGARMMGLDMAGTPYRDVCPKCKEIRARTGA